ncbi:hypothetical protein EST38_g8155 [Candolleomyces aberdarensis]|uniref:Uncharacterized protein n=1 Tax=Candolleomyces aberdarensis TaxID=2316362 RepID=A0A4Q2DFC6_9AGAR|nr:hypothetical protein EST38_g8155 [Candolleomyces aberdarensis]
MQLISTYSAVGALLLCLHALLGARKRYLYTLTGAYLIFFTTSLCLMSGYIHQSKGKIFDD